MLRRSNSVPVVLAGALARQVGGDDRSERRACLGSLLIRTLEHAAYQGEGGSARQGAGVEGQ